MLLDSEFLIDNLFLIVDNVVGTAAPKKEDLQDKKTIWCLSSGDVLTIEWGDGLNFLLENENSSESVCQTLFLSYLS